MKLNFKSLMMAMSFTSAFALVSCGDDSRMAGEDSDYSLMAEGDACPSNIEWDFKFYSGLGRNIYRFAKDRKGQRFGDGECATLVSAAVKSVGGKPFSSLGPTGPDANYVWGERIGMARIGRKFMPSLMAGDIVQFRNFATTWKPTPNSTRSMSAYHHTAIVVASSKDRRHLCVLEQNAPIGSGVRYGYVSIEGMTSGSITAYRATR